MSALTGEGLGELLLCIENIMNKELMNVTLEIPYSEGSLLNGIFTDGQVNHIIHTDMGTKIQALIPPALLDKLRDYQVK